MEGAELSRFVEPTCCSDDEFMRFESELIQYNLSGVGRGNDLWEWEERRQNICLSYPEMTLCFDSEDDQTFRYFS